MTHDTVLTAHGLGKTISAALGAVRLHAGRPGRSRGRAGRSERRRQDDPDAPRGRAARPDGGHGRGARRHRRRRARRSSDGSDSSPRTPRRTPNLTVADHLRLGRWLNARWDASLAERRIEQLGLDRRQRAGRLSGGQRAQLALTLAVAKRPELLVLDEPVASLDPLARREFLEGISDVAAEHGVSVVLSSHLVADLERVCDFVIVLVASRVRVAGTIDELLASRRDSGPDRVGGPASIGKPASLEDILLAYMGTEAQS